MDRVLAERGIGLVDAIALDIGVSSMQLDRADRGFSFSADGPLDMRMSKSGPTAAEFLNEADEAEIARVLDDYGEEPRARADRPRHRRRPADRARPASWPRSSAAPSAIARAEERSGDPHLPGDPHPSERRARRARAGARGRRAVAEARRPARGGHLPQPRGPHRQALLPRPQRSDASRVAPSPGRSARPRTDIRTGRQAGLARPRPRLARNPRVALGAAAQRGPHRGARAWQDTQETGQ